MHVQGVHLHENCAETTYFWDIPTMIMPKCRIIDYEHETVKSWNSLHSCSEILKFKLMAILKKFHSSNQTLKYSLYFYTTPYLYFSKYFIKVQGPPTDFWIYKCYFIKDFNPIGLASCCNKCSVSRIVERRRLVGKKERGN